MNGRPALGISIIDVGSTLEKDTDLRRSALACRQVQRGQSGGIALPGTATLVQASIQVFSVRHVVELHPHPVPAIRRGPGGGGGESACCDGRERGSWLDQVSGHDSIPLQMPALSIYGMLFLGFGSIRSVSADGVFTLLIRLLLSIPRAARRTPAWAVVTASGCNDRPNWLLLEAGRKRGMELGPGRSRGGQRAATVDRSGDDGLGAARPVEGCGAMTRWPGPSWALESLRIGLLLLHVHKFLANLEPQCRADFDCRTRICHGDRLDRGSVLPSWGSMDS